MVAIFALQNSTSNKSSGLLAEFVFKSAAELERPAPTLMRLAIQGADKLLGEVKIESHQGIWTLE
jgi:hypothetical protein